MTQAFRKLLAASKRMTQRTVLAGAVLGLAACTPLYRNHGYAPDEAQLAEVLVGIDSRDTVADVIGPPTAGGILQESGFYYVQSRFRTIGPFEPQEIDRQVVAITFDAEGLVRNVERFGLEDGRVVTLNRRITDDNLQDRTFIRQLLGNFGQINAGDFLGEP